MAVQIELGAGSRMFGEMQEFSNFGAKVKRYICRSLDIALRPGMAPEAWARDSREASDIRAQKQVYELLPAIRLAIPSDEDSMDAEAFLFPLIAATTFDVTCGPISHFGQYRFLYERLLGAGVRPWLPGAFCAAAALPHMPAELRDVLIASAKAALSDDWSQLEPAFCPQWAMDFDAMALAA
jgi:hypothetical protein